MLKKLTNNLGLKILSLFFAIALWLIVVNIDDPDVTTSFTVPVTIEHEEVLTDNGKVYEITDDTDSVRVVVTAKRSIIDNLSASDFEAVADFSDLDTENLDGTQKVTIDISALRYSSQISMNARSHYLEISVEDKATKRVVIDSQVWGSAADGYAAGDVTISPNVIEVSGPASIVDTIDSASVTVDISGMTSDIKQTMTPVYYDSDGNVVDTSKLTLDASEVTVNVACDGTKTVPVTYSVTGTPEDGYEIASVTGSVTELAIKGSPDVLSKCDSIEVTGDELSVDGLNQNAEVTIDLSDYLPDGVSLYAENANEATVEITVESASEKDYTLSTSNITINGLDSGLTAEFSSDTETVTLIGMDDVLNAITAKDIITAIDLTGKTAGTYSIELEITPPDNTTVSGSVLVPVVITSQSSTNE